jgi:Right handed beta helix region
VSGHDRQWPLGGALAGLFLLAAPASAQRVFVSARNGSDLNPCTIAAPCRTFGQAIATVTAGGEVIVLDSGGYGPFTVTKAVAIQVPAGIYAGISVASGTGITINAGPADQVVLRGLTLNGAGGDNGIFANSVGVLRVEDCIMNGFSSSGLFVYTSAAVFISGTVARNNGSGIGLSGGTIVASIDNCRLEKNSIQGLILFDGVQAAIRESVVSGNQTGILVFPPYFSVTGSALEIDQCLISGNAGAGAAGDGPGTIRVSNSTLTGNDHALDNFFSTIETFGNNRMRGNANPNAGTITTVSRN